MLRSMTGFGRGKASGAGLNIIVEIKSVNHRYLDIAVRMPRSFIFCEEVVKKIIKENVGRGKLEVFVTVTEDGEQISNISVNKGLALGYKAAFEELADLTGLHWSGDLKNIALMADVLSRNQPEFDEGEVLTVFERATLEAVINLNKMRELEATYLWQNILDSCEEITEAVEYLCTREHEVKANYLIKLREKMKVLLEDANVDETRLLMECAIFGDKICIDEEYARLTSHIEQMKVLGNKDGAVGKKMDFLTQEMNREANTMASKSSDVQMTTRILDIKGSVEKIREQVQNIE